MPGSDRPPIGLAQGRFREELGYGVEVITGNELLERGPALGSFDAGQQVGFDTEWPEVCLRPEVEIDFDGFGQRSGRLRATLMPRNRNQPHIDPEREGAVVFAAIPMRSEAIGLDRGFAALELGLPVRR